MKHSLTAELLYNYKEEIYRRKLTVKLKNAVMVHWLEVKKARVKPSIQDTIKELLKRKKMDNLDQAAANEEKKRARKEKRERERLDKIEKQKEAEAHLTSYINKDQFDILFESTLEINQKIY